MQNHKKILERLLNPKSFADYQLSITLPRAEAIALLNQVAEIKAAKAVVITGNAGVPDFYKEVIERTAEAAGRVKDWAFEPTKQPEKGDDWFEFQAGIYEKIKKQRGKGDELKNHFDPRQPCKICKHINVDEDEYPCRECKHNPHAKRDE
ncbi:MAG TPA: hypothetical protein PLM07_20965 [Candidatus Rifleibacterium sp.]|nr:hypothetical protein [Candidatus Rifleibacterium sp.]